LQFRRKWKYWKNKTKICWQRIINWRMKLNRKKQCKKWELRNFRPKNNLKRSNLRKKLSNSKKKLKKFYPRIMNKLKSSTNNGVKEWNLYKAKIRREKILPKCFIRMWTKSNIRLIDYKELKMIISEPWKQMLEKMNIQNSTHA
jgi:hypothetical protein